MMRRNWTLVGIVALASATGCKSQAQSDVSGVASATAVASVQAPSAPSVKARIGGTLIAAGDYFVEARVHGNGLLEALALDAKGELALEPEKIKLALTAAAKGGGRPSIELKWDPLKARFVGQAAAGVELVPGSVDVSLDVNGKASVGHIAELALSVEASHGGQVISVGDYSVELASNAGYAEAFVFDAAGKAHAGGDLDLKLDVGGKPLALAWDAASGSYRAKLDAGVDLAAKPIALELRSGGNVAVGAVQSFKADANATADLAAKGKLEADAKLGAAANVKVPDVSAQVRGLENAAASAKASLRVPAVDVKAPSVDVKAPTVNVGFTKSASANAGTSAGTSAGAGAKGTAKAGFSFGTK